MKDAEPELSYLAEGAARRLVIAAAFTGSIYTLYAVLYETVWSDAATLEAQIISYGMIGLSVAVVLLMPRASHRAAVVLSIAYEVATCLALEVARFVGLDSVRLEDGISWSVAVILFFPVLMSASPRVTVVGSLLSACMGPLGYHLARSLGAIRIDSGSVLSSYWLPLFLAALLSYVPARVLHRLGRDVKRARQMGAYELVERLGSGGMGEVWRARHRLLARPAAIKIIKPQVQNLRSLQERFEREAQATARLESPHTVKLFDFGISEDGSFYYVMELLRGIDLESLVGRFGPLPPERTVHLLTQLCESLQEAHEAHLVHRDIKPANIQVCKSAQHFDFVKVLDFGLVKETSAESQRNVEATAEGKIVGTPAYLAPEIAIGDQPVDGRADVYAVGCVAYYMLTGHPVFTHESPIKLALAHATSEPDKPSERLGAALPEALERLVLRCLKKRADERPQSARELSEQLLATGLAADWTQERRERWWQQHLPQLLTSVRPSSAAEMPTAFLNPAGSDD